MNNDMIKALSNFLAVLGMDEEPMGLFYTSEKPVEGSSPKPNDLTTREHSLRSMGNVPGISRYIASF